MMRLVITKEVIEGKEEYFLTKEYDDRSPPESIPIDFHRKCKEENDNSDPWQLWKEKLEQDEKDKNEEALDRPVKMNEKE